jgi:hypothetical protein
VDKRTGKERWKTERGSGRSSHTTPFVVDAPSGPELDVGERLIASPSEEIGRSSRPTYKYS